MPTQHTDQPYTSILDGMITCGVCKTEMRLINDHYQCQDNQKIGCTNRLVETEQTAVFIITHLLDDYLVPKVLRGMSKAYKSQFREPRRLHKQAVAKCETTVSALKERRADILRSVEHLQTTYQQAADDIHRINCTETSLQFQWAVAEKELSRMEAIVDTQRYLIRANPERFIQRNDPIKIRRQLQEFIESIQVDDDLQSIIYRKHIAVAESTEPDEDWPNQSRRPTNPLYDDITSE